MHQVSFSLARTPSDEPCAQTRVTANWVYLQHLECEVYRAALIARFGVPPEGARLGIRDHAHDFGSNTQVEICFDRDDGDHVAWFERVEDGLSTWLEANFTAPVDHVLFADTGDEHPRTYAFIPVFRAWLAARGIASTIVRNEVRNFKNWPPYRTLGENCLTNGTLPFIAFGFSSCSQKWKAAPQNRWAQSWAPAQRIWAAGGKVTKLIGYDCGPADQRRYAERAGVTDPLYEYRYPLREWGWQRADCVGRIAAAGLPQPGKSACMFCIAAKPEDLRDYPAWALRRIVLMEARAKPRLKSIDGLWRKSVKCCRGATPHPGSMTAFIRAEALLSAAEIDIIEASAPAALLRFQDAQGQLDVADRTPIADWLALFELLDDGIFDSETAALFAPARAA